MNNSVDDLSKVKFILGQVLLKIEFSTQYFVKFYHKELKNYFSGDAKSHTDRQIIQMDRRVVGETR